LAGGCASDPAPAACVSDLQLDCTPAYAPTYDTIFADVLVPRCGASSSNGTSCHYGPSAESAKGGLPLSDPDMAYRALLGELDGRARVIAGDPQCSILVERLESSDPNFLMPDRGKPLPEDVRCAVRQWVAMGAPRR